MIPNVTQSDVNDYFMRQKSYTLRARALYRFKRKQVISYGYFELAQADLADMSSVKRYNHGYTYILLLVDCLSKMIYTRPLKRKMGAGTTAAMKDIFNSFPTDRMFIHIQVDGGSEFFNKDMSALMEANGVTLFRTQQLDVKASVSEVGKNVTNNC